MKTSVEIQDHEARAIASIRARGFSEIAARFQQAPGNIRKYLDLDYWVPKNLRRVRELGLDTGPRRRVLDLGCGAGYFLYLCQLLGHEVLGVDVPDEPMYRAITEALGVPVTYQRVEPMCELGLKGYDVVTAFMITFNGHCEKPWGSKEWSFFLDDVAAPLVYLELNREYDGTLFPEGVEEMFRQRGAVIDEHRVTIRRAPRR